MQVVAVSRVTVGGEKGKPARRFMPGEVVTGLNAKDRKALLEAGFVAESLSEADVKAAREYRERVTTAEQAVEAAAAKVAAAEQAVKDAKNEKETKAAEDAFAVAESDYADAQAALEAIRGE